MRYALAVLTISLTCPAAASAQDERLPVVRPRVEIVKASPAPFPFADKQASDYDTWIRTPWVQMNRARCGQECLTVTVISNAGQTRIDAASAKNGVARLRMGVAIPAACASYAWYGEMRDQTAVGAGTTDPSENPIPSSRIHLFRFDERGREISMVFHNEHTASPRQARLSVLCQAR